MAGGSTVRRRKFTQCLWNESVQQQSVACPGQTAQCIRGATLSTDSTPQKTAVRRPGPQDLSAYRARMTRRFGTDDKKSAARMLRFCIFRAVPSLTYQRLENWKLLRALALPYFLRSTTRLSRVRKPAAFSAVRRPVRAQLTAPFRSRSRSATPTDRLEEITAFLRHQSAGRAGLCGDCPLSCNSRQRGSF